MDKLPAVNTKSISISSVSAKRSNEVLMVATLVVYASMPPVITKEPLDPRVPVPA